MRKKSDDDNYAFEEMMSLARSQPDKFCVIEAQVDVPTQMEYFELTSKLRNDIESLDIDILIEKLKQTSNDETIKETVILLSGISEVSAYRAIENFLEIAPAHLKAWCMLAYQEARFLLEASFLEESKIFISSALGGKKNKIRYSAVLLLHDDGSFDSFRKDITEKELNYFMNKVGAECESVVFEKNAAFISCLIPIHENFQVIFEDLIAEINHYGNFMSKRFIITNEKYLSPSDLDEYDSKNSGK